jgi:Mg-chelatase subunit ChlI
LTTGNPEEGELRPQLLDRFGMHAEIRTVKDANLRVQIVEQVGAGTAACPCVAHADQDLTA